MEFRTYDADTDLDAVVRIWLEVGWIGEEDREKAALGHFLSGGHAEVACIDGEAETMVQWTEGTMVHTDTTLPLGAVTAVTTSRIARKLGFASALTGRAVAQAAEAGHAVAALGMFEQGFYDRFGFGTGSPEVRFSFDPNTLRVDVPYRTPVRLTRDDWSEVHQSHLTRLRSHGLVTITPETFTRAELGWTDDFFGLGYRDADGELTHCIIGTAKDENGPYSLPLVTYRSPEQLLELLRLVRELGDQVSTVTMAQPAELSLQDLLTNPSAERRRRDSTTHRTSFDAFSWWQLRIIDLRPCVAAHDWPGDPVRCNLRLHDPLSERDDLAWPGVSGEHVLTVGSPSTVEPGHVNALPTLDASIGAFSRLWFGVRAASSLALTDDLTGPPELLASLDRALCLPDPHPGLYF